MPRVHSQAKQKNKPFKGGSKGKNKGNRIASTKRKPIQKGKGAKKASTKAKSARHVKANKMQLVKEQKLRKIHEVEKLTEKNEYLDQQTKHVISQKMKNISQIKIVLLLPCNPDADSNALLKSLYQSIDPETILTKTSQQMNACRSFNAFSIFPISNKTFLKNKIQFISPSSNSDIEQLIDLAKCADIICPILSCKSTNIQGMNLNPYEQGKAFDENGYTILNMVRTLGVPTTVGVIQHLEVHDHKHHDKVIRLFKRFLTSELGEEEKVIAIDGGNGQQINKLIRTIDSMSVNHQIWKEKRGYFMVENIKEAEDGQMGNIVIEGFLKGNCVNANQLVHLTGFDDFEIESIEIKQHEGKAKRIPLKKKANMEVETQDRLIQHSTVPQSLYPFAKTQQQMGDLYNKDNNELLSALEGLKFNNENENQQQQNLQQKSSKPQNSSMMNEEDNELDYEDMSEGDEMQEASFDEQEILGDKDDEKKKRIEMDLRKEDELQFEDEAEYTAQEVLREKFRNYQGLKNFKTSEWNHLENLPDEFDSIYTFKHYQRTQNSVCAENLSRGFAYPGFYVSVKVKGLGEKKAELEKHLSRFPLIATFLLKHERKMTTLHARVKRNPYYPLNETQIHSNQQYLISMGFRKFYIKPIFSRCINGTEKTKYAKTIKQDYESYFFCSFYYYNYFPPAPFSIYRVNHLNKNQVEPCPVMYGELVKCDPLHIILERTILCGYPHKVNRRRATVRYMFFNPKDVKFFRPIEVKTKMGLRGRIEESLGTHGLMKVFFSDHIKHNDTGVSYSTILMGKIICSRESDLTKRLKQFLLKNLKQE